MSQFKSIFAAGLVGAVVGGTAVHVGLAPGGSSEGPVSEIAAADPGGAAAGAGLDSAAASIRRGGSAEVATDTPQLEEFEPELAREAADFARAAQPARTDAGQRILEAPSWSEGLAERGRERVKRAKENPQPMHPELRAHLNDRTQSAAMAFVDASLGVLEVLGTPDEEPVRYELAKRMRNALYFSPEEIKPSLKRLYAATEAYDLEDPNADFEWREARKDVVAALDRLEDVQ